MATARSQIIPGAPPSANFLGLNDDPDAPIDGPEGPGGRTQNWGHTQQIFDLDPSEFNPGEGCNPNSNPLPPEL